MTKTITIIVTSVVFIAGFTSCKKEGSPGVQTVLKGHVSDTIRGINISGYKVVLVKKVRTCCSGWECGVEFEDVATAYTDNNGDYSILFNYHLDPGQDYYLSEQYYGIPYYHEFSSGTGIITPGVINTVDMYVWKPIELKSSIQVLNNNYAPLSVRNEWSANHTMFFGAENIYQQNITQTYSLRSRPNSDVNIIFWYYTGSYSSPVLHQKIIPYRTTLDDVATFSYTIDCSTF